MPQATLFPEFKTDNIVNVASVPMRSPFRYPGGKTWLIPRLREWLWSRSPKPAILIEPFAGGGIVGLTAAFEKLSDTVIMVEIDDQVAAVWKAILGDEAEWLANRILNFNLTPESFQNELARENLSCREEAFRTILRNRVNHGGILAPGSGIIKNGENGKGIQSRWYPETLRKRILDIDYIKDKVQFIHGDGLDVMRAHQHLEDIVFFIDPPYTAAGKKAGRRLYSCNELDHEELFSLAENIKGDFLMTYDNAQGVLDLAHQHQFDTEVISMKNTHHTKMTELLIGRDLSWLR